MHDATPYNTPEGGPLVRDQTKLLATFEDAWNCKHYRDGLPRSGLDSHLNFRSLTRRTRLKLSLQQLGKGKVGEAFKLGAMAETKFGGFKRTMQIAHRLKLNGYIDESLLYFGAAISLARDKLDLCEAIIELGHCAKVDSLYGLAMECFAYTAATSDLNAKRNADISAELDTTLKSLTSAFSMG